MNTETSQKMYYSSPFFPHIMIATCLSQPHVHGLFFNIFESTIASIRSLSQEILIQLPSHLHLVSERAILRQNEEYICVYLRETNRPDLY